MAKIKQFFKTRSVGFWIFAAALSLALIENIIYVAAYMSDPETKEYFSVSAFIMPFIGIGAGIVMSVFKPTEKWAPLALFIMELAAFCLFFNDPSLAPHQPYVYLSTKFFAGFSVQALFSVNVGFLTSVFMFIAIFIITTVAFAMKMSKPEEVQPAVSEQTQITDEGEAQNEVL